jgi:hypothetical protein
MIVSRLILVWLLSTGLAHEKNLQQTLAHEILSLGSALPTNKTATSMHIEDFVLLLGKQKFTYLKKKAERVRNSKNLEAASLRNLSTLLKLVLNSHRRICLLFQGH